MKYQYEITVDGERFSVSVDGDLATVNGEPHTVDALFDKQGLSFLVDGKVFSGHVLNSSNALNKSGYIEAGTPCQITLNHHIFDVCLEDQRSSLLKTLSRSQGTSSGSAVIAAPMPGLVSKILVTVGEQASAGQGVAILEAMKMENEIRSSRDGLVVEILVRPGEPVEKGQTLMRIESQPK